VTTAAIAITGEEAPLADHPRPELATLPKGTPVLGVTNADPMDKSVVS
jgi:hypothetical protein